MTEREREGGERDRQTDRRIDKETERDRERDTHRELSLIHISEPTRHA